MPHPPTNDDLINDLDYQKWRKALIAETVEATGLKEHEIKINDAEAYQWFKGGHSPYYTFRETWNMENDCGA